MDILADENMEYLTLEESASFWWLSLDGAVRAIVDLSSTLLNHRV